MFDAVTTMAAGAAALGCAIMGGVYFAFSAFVMAALDTRPPREAADVMRAINKLILGSAFLPIFLGTAILALLSAGLAAFAWSGGAATAAGIGALTYVAGSAGLTAAFNVPLNDRLEEALADDIEAWRAYKGPWTRWNTIRAAASLAAAVVFVAAMLIAD